MAYFARIVFQCCLLSILFVSYAQATGIKEKTALFENSGQEVAIKYIDQGQGGTPLVLIHGWACDTTFWHAQLVLAQERRVLALDLPGHGASAPVQGEYTQDLFARAVLAVMDAAGIEQAVLAGHSMGGAVARNVAQQAPERVAGVILVDAALFFPPLAPEQAAALKEWEAGMAGFFAQLEGGDDAESMARFVDSMLGAETPDELTQEVKKRMTATPRNIRLSAMKNFIVPEIWGGAPVEAPTLGLFVWYAESPPGFYEQLQGMFANIVEYTVWKGPGHFVMQERPELVNQRIRDFFSQAGLE